MFLIAGIKDPVFSIAPPPAGLIQFQDGKGCKADRAATVDKGQAV
jgi:hypothetical protein